MASSYKSINTTYGVRSISLPTTSQYSSTDRINKELKDMEERVMSSSSSSKPSVEAMYDGLLKLSRLYECLHEFINMLCSIQKEKWVEEAMDRLVGFMDICDMMKDIMSRYKEHVRDIQCALRRRKGDSGIGNSITRYNCFRKRVKKDVKRLIKSLKQSKVAKSQNHHHQCEGVVKMVMEVTMSIYESLLMYLVMPYSQSPKANNKWSSVVSKLIPRTRIACEGHHYQHRYDNESLAVVLRGEWIRGDGFLSWQNDACKWEGTEAEIERIEDGLECLFRNLIRTRSSLLNIISNY